MSPSPFTAYRKLPCCPRCTAAAGTDRAFGSVRGTSTTSRYCPGQKRAGALAKRPFMRIVPVVLSTVLSTKISSPSARGPWSSGARASTRGAADWPAAAACWAACTTDSQRSGTAKVTRIGSVWVMVASTTPSEARTKFPAFTGSAPSRPGASARIVAKSRFSRVCASSASSARTTAAAAVASACACSSRCCEA